MAVLLIVGKGNIWREDVERFRSFGVHHDVMGLNHAALWLDPAPTLAYSYHPNIMDEVKRRRPGVTTYSMRPSGGVDHVFRDVGSAGGSSALQAVFLAKRLGYGRIVLAGVPLSGRYFVDFVPQWIAARNELYPIARSMSGATWALLGPPNVEWLKEGV